MPAPLALYLSAEACSLYRWHRVGLRFEKQFPAGNGGLSEFLEFVSKHRGALLHVVIDVAGEDFHEEAIPHLRGSERTTVIERRLAQRYREARFSAAVSLGRVSDGRRSERLVLASFPQSGPLKEWFDALLEVPLTIAGVHSPGLLAPALASRLEAGSGDSFLITVNSAGLRQSFLENGRLRLSRLEPVPGDGISPAFVRREIERMLRFLDSARASARQGRPLSVLLLVPDADHARFEAELKDDGRLAFKTIGVSTAARKLGVRHLPRDAAAGPLYLHLAAKKPPKEQFLRAADRRPFLAWRLRRAMAAVGASAFAACLAYAGLLWLEDRTVRAEIASARLQSAQLRAEEQRLRAAFPVAAANAETVKAAALQFRRIAARAAGPEPALLHLSHALDSAPEIEIDALSWETTEAGAEALEVSGRIPSAEHADLRSAGERIERFAKLASSGGEWQVASTRLPFDAAPQNSVAGDFSARDAGERMRFSLTLARASR